MNKKMLKIKNQGVSQAPSQGLLKPNVVRIDLKRLFRLNKKTSHFPLKALKAVRNI